MRARPPVDLRSHHVASCSGYRKKQDFQARPRRRSPLPPLRPQWRRLACMANGTRTGSRIVPTLRAVRSRASHKRLRCVLSDTTVSYAGVQRPRQKCPPIAPPVHLAPLGPFHRAAQQRSITMIANLASVAVLGVAALSGVARAQVCSAPQLFTPPRPCACEGACSAHSAPSC